MRTQTITLLILAQGAIGMSQEFTQHTLSTTGSTRGTAYTLSNKIVSWGGRTHFAWLGNVAECMVATLDRNTGEWLGTWNVGTGFDNHGGPAMVADSLGYLHIVFGPHHGDIQYRRSARPNDASEWIDMGVFGKGATYPSLVCDSTDTLHCTYRGLGNPWQTAYQRKPKDGDWSDPVALVDAAVPDGYTQYTNALAVGQGDSLHLAFHIYDLHPAGGKSAGYLKSADGGDSWTLADDTPVELPYTPDMPGWVEQGPDLDMRVGNVALSPEALPYFVIGHYKPKPGRAALYHWDGEDWVSRDLAPEVRALMPGAYIMHGTCSFDDRGVLYVAVSASERGSWGDPTQRVFLLVSDDRGLTFETTMLSDADSPASNWFPSLERTTGHNRVSVPHLIYTIGQSGSNNAESLDTEIRAVTLDR